MYVAIFYLLGIIQDIFVKHVFNQIRFCDNDQSVNATLKHVKCRQEDRSVHNISDDHRHNPDLDVQDDDDDEDHEADDFKDPRVEHLDVDPIQKSLKIWRLVLKVVDDLIDEVDTKGKDAHPELRDEDVAKDCLNVCHLGTLSNSAKLRQISL